MCCWENPHLPVFRTIESSSSGSSIPGSTILLGLLDPEDDDTINPLKHQSLLTRSTRYNTIDDWIFRNSDVTTSSLTRALWPWTLSSLHKQLLCLPIPRPVCKVADDLEVISSGGRACWSTWSTCWLSHCCSWTQVNCWWRCWRRCICVHLLLTLGRSWHCWWFGWFWDCLKEQKVLSVLLKPVKYTAILLLIYGPLF
jgi:hypothetical protein